MGTHNFRLSEMIPNASWFYKLRKMANHKSTRDHHHQNHQPTKKKLSPPSQTPPPPHLLLTTTTTSSRITKGSETELPLQPHYDCISQPRKSYYFTREFKSKTNPQSSDSPELDPPRKSSRTSRRRRRPTTIKRTPSLTTPSSTSTTTVKYSPSSSSFSSPDHLSLLHGFNYYQDDIVIDVEKKPLDRKMGNSVSHFELPPIRTERKKFSDSVKQIGGTQEAIDGTLIKQRKSSVKCRGGTPIWSSSIKSVKEESMASPVFKEQRICPAVGRLQTGSPRVRVRTNSPRIARRARVNSSRASAVSRKNISSESLAVVKSSIDPQRDFRESMMEMIVENNIRASKDLEELLACYLSLNSHEYHHMIVEAFREIWFDLYKKYLNGKSKSC